MNKFTQFLIEGKGTPTYKKHPLIGHFRAVTKGMYDNMKWSKGDVGRYSSTFKDSHGFVSMYMRFKGEKTSRLMPDSVFRKHFEKTGTGTIDTKKWAKVDKGGTSIEYGKRKNVKLSKDEVKVAIKKSTGGKAPSTVQKEGIETMDNLTEGEVAYHYSIKKKPDGKFVIQRRAKNPVGSAHAGKLGKPKTLDHAFATLPEAQRKMTELKKNSSAAMAAGTKVTTKESVEMDQETSPEDTSEVTPSLVENMVDCAVSQDGVKFKDLFTQELELRINAKMDEAKMAISEKLVKDGEEAGAEGEADGEEVDTEEVEDAESPTEDEVDADEVEGEDVA